jgi:axial budding pattern protein 2
MHPTINPPPRIALSAATWSSAPPSTYRAVVDGGGNLPAWLHFDARELELWGVPALGNSGDLTTIKIIETLPRDKRTSDPMQFGYQPPQEREVGRVTVE